MKPMSCDGDPSDKRRGWRYVVITPCKNDALLLPCIFGSLLTQTVRPDRWVIVDDNSSDWTFSLATSLAQRYDWIHVARMEEGNKGRRRSGGATAFLSGYELVKDLAFDFVANLDADVSLPPDYFERIFELFESDQSLGICGGHCYNLGPDRTIRKEWVPDEHVRGATKLYRKACFDSIGGVVACEGWDTIDETYAQIKGWKTKSVDSPGVLHLGRVSSVGGVLRAGMQHGRDAYYLGYHPLFVLARFIRLCFSSPFVFCGTAFMFGFLLSAGRGEERFADPEMRHYLRRQQQERLRHCLRELRTWLSGAHP